MVCRIIWRDFLVKHQIARMAMGFEPNKLFETFVFSLLSCNCVKPYFHRM